MLLFLGSSQISGGGVVGSGGGIGETLQEIRELPPPPSGSPSGLSQGGTTAGSFHVFWTPPQNAQESVARQETKKEDPGSSSPQSHDRRPVRVSRGHQFPHATPPVCAGKFSELQRGAKNLPSSSPPSPSCLLRAREPGSGRGAGRGGANRAGAASCCRGDSDC